MRDFDSYLPTFIEQIQLRLSERGDSYKDDYKLIRYCDVRTSLNDQIRFQFNLPSEEREQFSGVLFVHTLLSQIIHFHVKEFPGIQSISKKEERQILFPEIIGGLLSSYDLHICPTVIPLGALYVNELDDDIIRHTGSHLSSIHARITWCRKHQLFEDAIQWLKMNIKEKVLLLTDVTINSTDEEKLLQIIDREMKKFDAEFGYQKI
jgi:hypothetical protein